MLQNTFLTWYYRDVLSHFHTGLSQGNEINLGFHITRFISNKVTISFVKESIPNDKVICNSKIKYTISVN